jgi:succinate dehydrogenase/fumarate reductase flavoprotein subunit
MALRDRFFTRRVARAMTSPSAIVLAGGVAAGAILAPIPLAVAPIAGLVAYAARVAAAMDRKSAQTPDLRTLSEPWRTFVVDAMDACARFGRAVSTADAGPLRERLTEISRRLDDDVTESWRIARRGMALEAALAQLEDTREVARRLEAARRSRDVQLEQSLQAQLDSTNRIVAVSQDARRRLQLLDARLDEAVARAVELALSADPQAAGGLGGDVDAVVGDMEALRQALEETNRPSQAVG